MKQATEEAAALLCTRIFNHEAQRFGPRALQRTGLNPRCPFSSLKNGEDFPANSLGTVEIPTHATLQSIFEDRQVSEDLMGCGAPISPQCRSARASLATKRGRKLAQPRRGSLGHHGSVREPFRGRPSSITSRSRMLLRSSTISAPRSSRGLRAYFNGLLKVCAMPVTPTQTDWQTISWERTLTAGGVASAIDRACANDCAGMQIFMKNSMQWFAKLGKAEARGSRAPLRGSSACFLAAAILSISLPATRSPRNVHALVTRELAGEPARPSVSRAPSGRAHGPGRRGGLERGRQSRRDHGFRDQDPHCAGDDGRRGCVGRAGNWPSSCAAAASRATLRLHRYRAPLRRRLRAWRAEGIVRTFAQFEEVIRFNRSPPCLKFGDRRRLARTAMNTSAKAKSGWTRSGHHARAAISQHPQSP